jgi:hypothetical protein
MVFSISPSVTVKEVDLTTTIPAIATPPAAIAGVFRWGPVNERVLLSSEIELTNIFGKPSDFNAETFFTAADFLAYSNALYVTRVVSATDLSTLTAAGEYFNAKYPGALGNSISVSIVTTPQLTSGQTTANTFAFEEVNVFGPSSIVSANVAFNTSTITIESLQQVTSIVEDDVLRIGNDSIGFQDLQIADIDTDVAVVGPTTTYTYTIKLRNRYTLPEQNIANLQLTRRWKYASLVAGAPEPGTMHIVVSDKTGAITGTAGQVLEKYENISALPLAQLPDGTNNFYKNVISTGSRWIVPVEASISPAAIIRDYADLENGADGDNENVISFGRVAQGYDLYKEANDVDVALILQGKAQTPNIANYIVANIVEYRKDCMAFLSPRREDVVNVSSSQEQMNNVISYRSAIQNSSYWIMDTGYKYRYDKYNDVYRWTPLNGDIAGLAARVDPWESPAGFRKGRIRNLIKLAFNPNKTQRDQLYGKDINPVMTQVGQGTVLFGDKTGLGTASGSAFTRINVRRLFITVEKAIATIAAQFLFEFNDEFTQNQFRQVVDPFLRDIQGRRGIIDFRVISDATVNTPDVIDRNTFRANIFIKPARSINFIELTFIATRTGVQFEEIVGQQF